MIGWWATLAAAVVLCTALPAGAQERGQGRARGFRGGFGGGQVSKLQLLQAEQVQQELKLTDEQKQQVEQIGEDVSGKRREAFQGGQEGGFARMREISEEADEKLEQALKEDQAKRLQEIWLQVSGPAVLARDRELAQELKVSREQQQEIRELLEAQGEKSREAFSSAEGEGRERFAAAREKLEEIRKETETQVVAVLTDDQKQQWKEMTGKPFEFDRSQLRFGFGGRGPGGGRPRGNN